MHRRITEAAVELHEKLGPAKTTMEGIAKLAGVQRATVYNHFPTELELLEACSGHWFKDNPPPDRSTWAEIADPKKKVRTAFELMYSYFRSGERMLANVLTDAAFVPAMEEIRKRSWVPMLDQIAGELAESLIKANGTKQGKLFKNRLLATLATALDFFNWQRLAQFGLSDSQAAELATVWVAGVVHEIDQ